MNECGSNGWLQVELIGPEGNAEGFGAQVVAVFGEERFTREIQSLRSHGQSPSKAHFGAGEEAMADRIEVHWPDGHVSVAKHARVNRVYSAKHPDAVDAALERTSFPRFGTVQAPFKTPERFCNDFRFPPLRMGRHLTLQATWATCLTLQNPHIRPCPPPPTSNVRSDWQPPSRGRRPRTASKVLESARRRLPNTHFHDACGSRRDRSASLWSAQTPLWTARQSGRKSFSKNPAWAF